MPIFKIQNQTNFAAIPNATLRDKRLSVESRGALAYLLTHDQAFEISFAFLQKELGIGRDKLKSIARELKRAGYLCLAASHDRKGAFSGQEWFVFAESQNVDFTVQTYDRLTEKPSVGKTVSRENRQTENPPDNKKENSSQKKNEEKKEKKFLSPRAGAEGFDSGGAAEIVGVTETESDAERLYHETIVAHLKIQMNTKITLPDEREWRQAIEWARINEFSAEEAIQTYNLLAAIKSRKRGRWSITPAFWKRSIPKIEALREELEELTTGLVKTNGNEQKQNENRETDRQRRERESAERRALFDRKRRLEEAEIQARSA